MKDRGRKRREKQAGKPAARNVFWNGGFSEPCVYAWDMTSSYLTEGISTTGSMSTSRSNGQPQSGLAVNQSDYRKPLVQGYTIKSSNGLIKPATPQQTFWFRLLRAARSLGWVKIRKTFFFVHCCLGSRAHDQCAVRYTEPWAIYLHCTPEWIL